MRNTFVNVVANRLFHWNNMFAAYLTSKPSVLLLLGDFRRGGEALSRVVQADHGLLTSLARSRRQEHASFVGILLSSNRKYFSG
jgi:hypothetical protein